MAMGEQLTRQGNKLADNRNMQKTNRKECDIIIGCNLLWSIGKHNTHPGQNDTAAWKPLSKPY